MIFDAVASRPLKGTVVDDMGKRVRMGLTRFDGVWLARNVLASVLVVFAMASTAMANDRPVWPVSAYEHYTSALKCHQETPDQCAAYDCAAIEKEAAWLGALCFADKAQAAGKQREYKKQSERAFKLFTEAYGKNRLRFIPEHAQVSSVEGAARPDALASFLRDQAKLNFAAAAWVERFEQKSKELDVLKARAESGDVRAQLDYAVKLDETHDPRKWLEATTWYRKAAEKGLAGAQLRLGFMYGTGRGVPKDDAQAVTWYRKAAEQGLADAQYNLGLTYADGLGVPRDDAVAVTWYRKAAEQGDVDAENNLGVMYANGRGVSKDDVQAAAWYRRAAERGNTNAQLSLGAMYDNGRGVPKDYVQAVAWYRKAAEQGHASAQFNLGVMYANGHGVPKDDVQAVTWYRKAAEQGVASAQFNLGVRYDNGQGVAKDDAQAIAWYRKAAGQGHAGAQFNLGSIYANGQGVPKDDAQAVAWYRKAAEQGDAGAQNWVGKFYESGKGGLLQDYAEAAGWYRKAAIQGDKYAQRNLAKLYWHGLGVPPSLVTAYAWMNLSAASGHPNAPEERDQLAAQLSSADLQKGQQLSRAWKPGQLIPEVRATSRPNVSQSSRPAISRPVIQSVSAGSRYPTRPAKTPGKISCNTQCTNGDCYRTYDDGRQVRFQAQREFKFGEWVWDTKGC